jgi:5-deoxy-glucuronate isomerase
MSELHLKPRKLSATESGTLISVDPKVARWDHISFEVFRLQPGETRQADTGGEEHCLVFLGGTGSVHSSEGEFEDVGHRPGVFDGKAHAVYLPLGTRYTVTARTGLEVAVCRAPARTKHPARHIQPADIEVEERGDGNASRTIHHLLKPEFPADMLMLVEVYTPSGNWSSYPPHKHDRHQPPDEHDLEEVYYYRIDRPEGFAIQRVYTDDRRVDETLTVQDGEIVLVREGYHPVVAAPGCSVYYLNVLAGTGRSMAATDDPQLAWVRGTWKRPQRPIR